MSNVFPKKNFINLTKNFNQNKSNFKPYTKKLIEIAQKYKGNELVFCNTRNFIDFFNFLNENEVLTIKNLNNLFTKEYSERNEMTGFCLSRLVYTFIQQFNRKNPRIQENIVLNRLLESNNITRLNYKNTNLGESNIYFEEFTIYPNNTPAVMIFYLIVPEQNGYKIKIIFSIRGTQTLDDIFSLAKPQQKDVYLFNTNEILQINENLKKPYKKEGFLKFGSNTIGNPTIHKGFRGYFRKIDKIILRKTLKFINMFSKRYGNKYKYLGSEFCFIGHSLGGALAVLNSLNSLTSGYKTFIYSYCQPRIGGDKFNYFLYSQLLRNPESKYFLFYNKDDTVNYLPPRNIGYIHLSEFLKENELNLDNYEEKNKQTANLQILEKELGKTLKDALGYFSSKLFYSKILHSLFLYKIAVKINGKKYDDYYLLHS